MQSLSAWMLALVGFAIGAAAGFAVRHAKLCSFGAIEDALMGGDSRRLRIFGLALGIAIVGTQALVIGGLLDPAQTTYTPAAIPIVAIIIGSVMFGVGMALVGTCGFGSLVRLGAGDLRSLIVLIVLGATAYATLRGVFANFRIVVLEGLSIAMPDDIRSDLASLSARTLGYDVRALIAAIAGGGLCLLAFSHPRLRRSPRLLSAGVALGLLTVAGWIATSWIGDEFSGPMRPQSLTFVSTVGKAFYAALLSTPGFADFGVGSVFGVIAGAFLAAWRSDELQWEAFDDDREMRRHLGGAALMGIGGILAGGCTIGQGITAGSMLSLSWPFAVGGMMIGARLGIATLIDTTPRQLLSRSWASLLGKTHPSK
ncbi:YeeE/YedE family protein [Rhodopseudomonas sp. P2A-2r]|uniref:YeeE/YedE family protein n=1 Tax=Rhodopseudomonas sp. P2A-2r TaxID=2991972 RepID=UPI0022342C5B|nr:YeeE/YedE family protein [Rhodopseudomonas sp. P2A-2r]UZE50745.1 YeeE/YedE family protein [Rhodopseudomonas sp. P2A-2r]